MAGKTEDTVDLGPQSGGARPTATGSEGGALAPGTCIGRYVIEQRIGEGGMGAVFCAYDPKLERRVALKLLHLDPQSDDDKLLHARERHLREAKALAQLSHPNVVAAYDVGSIGADLFIAMELVEGGTLAEWLKRPRTRAEILRVFVAAGEGLAAAHAAGLVHRDFKPGNVLIGDDGRVRVGDFGLARSAAEPRALEAAAAPRPSAPPPSMLRSPLTADGTVLGTPGYMAPEQYLGQEATARSDQFGFAAALFEALYGQRPFDAADFEQLSNKVQRGAIDEPAQPRRVPAWLRRILERALSPDPEDRYPSMRELLAEIDRKRRTITRRRWAGAGLALLGAVASAGVIVGARESPATSCQALARRWDGVWDPATRRSMQARFVATGRKYAGRTFAEVSRRLDDYLASWTAQATATCQAIRVGGERSQRALDLRMACLDRRFAEARARIGVLVDTRDPATVDRAVDAALGLPPLDVCSDDEFLLAATPPPEDPQARAQLESGRRDLDDALALEQVGRYSEGIAAARTVVDEANRLGWAPFSADAWLALATVQADVDDTASVSRDLEAALQEAARARDDQITARAWIANLMNLAKQNQLDRARTLELPAELAVDRAGAAPALRAALLRSKARLRFEQAHYDEARPLDEEAVAVLSNAFGAKDLRVADAVVDLGNVDSVQGRLTDALAAYGRALSIESGTLGPDHPSEGRVFADRAIVYHRLGRRTEARADYLRALDLFADAGGRDSARLINTLGALGLLEHEMGDLSDAAGHFERQLALSRRAYGEAHASTALAHANIAVIHFDRKQYDAARAEFTAALATLEKVLGRDHPYVSYSLLGLGSCDVEQARYRSAVPLLQRALAVAKANPGDAGNLADIEFALARALFGATGTTTRPLALAGSARATYAAYPDRYASQVGRVDRFVATLH